MTVVEIRHGSIAHFQLRDRQPATITLTDEWWDGIHSVGELVDYELASMESWTWTATPLSPRWK